MEVALLLIVLDIKTLKSQIKDNLHNYKSVGVEL